MTQAQEVYTGQSLERRMEDRSHKDVLNILIGTRKNPPSPSPATPSPSTISTPAGRPETVGRSMRT